MIETLVLIGFFLGIVIALLLDIRKKHNQLKEAIYCQPGFEAPPDPKLRGKGKVMSDFTPEEFETHQLLQLRGWAKFYDRLARITGMKR